MKEIIRITESDLHNIIEETVNHFLQECDAPGGAFNSGASGDGNLVNGTSDPAGGAIFASGFVQRKKGYSPKGSSSGETNEVDMSDATARHNGKDGSISIPKKRA